MASPVVVFAYKRAKLVKQVLDALQNNILADDTDVFVFANTCIRGHKDEAKVQETHEMLLGYKNIFKSYTVIVREKPLSILMTMMSGLDEVFQHYDRVIVLEDDILPARNFLSFMNGALTEYYEDEEIFSICGYPAIKVDCVADSYKSLIFRSWGYALWREKYRKVDALQIESYMFNIENIHLIARDIPVFFPFFTLCAYFLTDSFYLDTLLTIYQYSQKKYTMFSKIGLLTNICDGDSASSINSSLIQNFGFDVNNSKVNFTFGKCNVRDILNKHEYINFANCGNWYELIIKIQLTGVFYTCVRNSIMWSVFNNIPCDYFFKKHNIRRIAIYACGECGKLFYKFIEKSDYIEIVYAMDREISQQLSVEIPTYSSINKKFSIDAVIVCFAEDFNNIRMSLDFDDSKIFDVMSIMIETHRDFGVREKLLPIFGSLGGK